MITGGTGLIGTAVSDHLLSQGYKVIVLTRNPASAGKSHPKKDGKEFAKWDVKRQSIDADAVGKANIVIHLAGAGVVDKRWTRAYKKEIISSRVDSSALIVRAINSMPNNIHTVISASAIGWYGPDKPGQGAFIETDLPDQNFLGTTCQEWEQSIKPVSDAGKRLVIFRFGIVLSKKGGALKEFIRPLKFRLATVIGNGRQMMSWIHITDLSRMMQFAIENSGINGVYNAVSPIPVTNEALTLSLGKAMHGNVFFKTHVPEFIIKLLLGERSVEVLKSATVSSKKVEETGFIFRFPAIEEALNNIVAKD